MDEDILVVRLKTDHHKSDRGIVERRSLLKMKRLSRGFDILEEDSNNIGVELVFRNIVNLYKCKDGLYEIQTCNESLDHETGYVDDYDYMLVPYASTKGANLPE